MICIPCMLIHKHDSFNDIGQLALRNSDFIFNVENRIEKAKI